MYRLQRVLADLEPCTTRGQHIQYASPCIYLHGGCNVARINLRDRHLASLSTLEQNCFAYENFDIQLFQHNRN